MDNFIDGLSEESKSIVNAAPELKEMIEKFEQILDSRKTKNIDLEYDLDGMQMREEKMENQLEYSGKIISRLSVENEFIKKEAEAKGIDIIEEIRERLFF